MGRFSEQIYSLMGGMRPWRFKLVAMLLTLVIVSAMSILIHGAVTWDYLLTGFVASLLVAYLVTDMIYAGFRQVVETTSRYRLLFECGGDAISILDKASGRFTDVNAAWIRLYGYSREEAMELAPLGLLTGEQPGTADMATGLQWHRNKGGAIFPVEISKGTARLDGLEVTCIISRDISDQVDAEQALQASESSLRSILESMVDGVIVIDERGAIESFNPAAERIFGYGAGEVLGHNVSLLMPEPFATAHDGYLRRHLETGEARIIGIGREVTGRRKDGSTFPMELAVSALSSGARRRFTGIVRDIGARKQTELELVHALEVAQSANRAKSEFLSSMSHELRTPMNAILGFAQLLEFDAGLEEDQADNVREILKAGRHLLALINEVLDLSRIEAGKLTLSMEPVALVELIEECAALVESGAARQGLSFSRDIASCENRWIRADRLRLKQALINLLSNAVKYNQAGGNVRIECGFTMPGRVRLSVIDTGLGIPEDRQAELFTAFHRLGRESSGIEGTGIGLVISKRLVELMGGEIGMESRPGVGSTFWIELAESAPLLPAASDENASPGHTGTGDDRPHTLLYVEDNPANLRLMQLVLARRAGIRLLTSGTPSEGLELAHAEQPDLILLDINLPEMDGYEMLDRLKNNPATRAIPVIAISANAMPGDIQRGLEAGFLAYLTKPLDLNPLHREIDRVLHNARPVDAHEEVGHV